jgi:hypothetical protein
MFEYLFPSQELAVRVGWPIGRCQVITNYHWQTRLGVYLLLARSDSELAIFLPHVAELPLALRFRDDDPCNWRFEILFQGGSCWWTNPWIRPPTFRRLPNLLTPQEITSFLVEI